MPSGEIDEKFPIGSYSCMFRHLNFYTVFIKECDIVAAGLELGDVAMSPLLNPGHSRIVLTWGAKVCVAVCCSVLQCVAVSFAEVAVYCVTHHKDLICT